MLTRELDALLQILLGCCLVCLSLCALRLIARRSGIEQLVFRRKGPGRCITTEYYRQTLWLRGNLGSDNRGGNFNICGRSIVSLGKTRPGCAEHHRGAEAGHRSMDFNLPF